MSQSGPHSFDFFIQQIRVMPLWVKQVIYAMLRLELESTLSKRTLDTFGYDDLMQLMVPEVTPLGQRELDQPNTQTSQGVLKLLQMAKHQKTVINIAIANSWTLEQCAVYLKEALDKQFINPPKSPVIRGTIDYLAGHTRLGEYLVKINRLTVEQLDQALRTQKYIEESMGERTGIANVLINLGFIHKVDSESILFLKEESKKPYQIGGQQPPATQSQRASIQGFTPKTNP